jgi:hypothetical protein
VVSGQLGTFASGRSAEEAKNEFAYITILDTKYKPLELIEEKLTADAPRPWYNETLCNVTDSVIRLGAVAST